MKTLVLGGTGFVGRRLVEILTADGARVTVLNRGVTPAELPPGVARRPVLLPYHGLVVGSYGHVDDLCRALLVMATHPSAVGEVFNVTTSAVTSAAYVATLAEVAGMEPDVVLLPDDLAQAADRPLFSRLFAPAHHGMLDPGKITRVLGLTPVYDLRAGHAQTLEWFRRSGAAVVDQALSDPLWGRTFDLAYEAEVAARARAR